MVFVWPAVAREANRSTCVLRALAAAAAGHRQETYETLGNGREEEEGND